MSRARRFVKRVPTTYCGFLLGQSQDVANEPTSLRRRSKKRAVVRCREEGQVGGRRSASRIAQAAFVAGGFSSRRRREERGCLQSEQAKCQAMAAGYDRD